MHKDGRTSPSAQFKKQHLSLSNIKKTETIKNDYLRKPYIPDYPELVEFQVKKVSHVTGEHGVLGIFANSGFKQPSNLENNKHYFLWWNLSVTSHDIFSAENRFLTSLFPGRSAAQICNGSPILQHFTNSEAFLEESSYGNFRFTFSLKELLMHYGKRFCGPDRPVLHIYDTALYKKEIQYTVVVHPPNVHLYDDYPRLPNDGVGDSVCWYINGAMWWRCQSPSDDYNSVLEVNRFDGSVSVSHHDSVYYVWDHVSVAFHMEPGWVLHVDRDRLFETVTACEMSDYPLLRYPDVPLSLCKAKSILADLKTRYG